MKYYSKTTGGFYDPQFHTSIPADKVQVSDDEHAALLEGQSKGKRIVSDTKGHPILADPPEQEVTVESLIARAANKRWQVETGGLTIGGVEVATDDRSKIMIMGARMMAESNPGYTEDWKIGDGEHVTLSAQQLIAISDAVLKHVSDCFSAEAEVVDKIKAGEIKSFAEIDAYAWPGGAP